MSSAMYDMSQAIDLTSKGNALSFGQAVEVRRQRRESESFPLPRLRTLRPRLPAASQMRAPWMDTAGGAHAAHYQSASHKAWRAAVLERDGFTCQQCGARGGRLVADHVREIVDGGEPLEVANGRTLCLACHNAKTARARAARLAP